MSMRNRSLVPSSGEAVLVTIRRACLAARVALLAFALPLLAGATGQSPARGDTARSAPVHVVATIPADTGPTISINDVARDESGGLAGGEPTRFSITLSQAMPTPVTVDVATFDGTATAASGDFVA